MVTAGGETQEKGSSWKCLSLWGSRYSYVVMQDKAVASADRQVLKCERLGIMHDHVGGMCTSCASSSRLCHLHWICVNTILNSSNGFSLILGGLRSREEQPLSAM